jgi:predicted trehalose synthase
MEEGKSGEKKKVMVAIDESENSHYALEWALDKLRETIADSDVIIFTAQPNSDLGYLYASTFGTARKFLLISLMKILFF